MLKRLQATLFFAQFLDLCTPRPIQTAFVDEAYDLV